MCNRPLSPSSGLRKRSITRKKLKGFRLSVLEQRSSTSACSRDLSMPVGGPREGFVEANEDTKAELLLCATDRGDIILRRLAGRRRARDRDLGVEDPGHLACKLG